MSDFIGIGRNNPGEGAILGPDGGNFKEPAVVVPELSSSDGPDRPTVHGYVGLTNIAERVILKHLTHVTRREIHRVGAG